MNTAHTDIVVLIYLQCGVLSLGRLHCGYGDTETHKLTTIHKNTATMQSKCQRAYFVQCEEAEYLERAHTFIRRKCKLVKLCLQNTH